MRHPPSGMSEDVRHPPSGCQRMSDTHLPDVRHPPSGGGQTPTFPTFRMSDTHLPEEVRHPPSPPSGCRRHPPSGGMSRHPPSGGESDTYPSPPSGCQTPDYQTTMDVRGGCPDTHLPHLPSEDVDDTTCPPPSVGCQTPTFPHLPPPSVSVGQAPLLCLRMTGGPGFARNERATGG